MQQPATIGRAHLGPRAFFESLASGFDRQIDVGLVSLSDLANHLAGGRVKRWERLARRAVLPFAANEQRLIFNGRRLGGTRLGSGGGGGGHGRSPGFAWTEWCRIRFVKGRLPASDSCRRRP